MIYLLDSNAWIGHLRQTAPTVTGRLMQVHPDDVALCSIVLAELLFGVERSASTRRAANLALISRLRSEFVSLPFDDSATVASLGKKLFTRLKKKEQQAIINGWIELRKKE